MKKILITIRSKIARAMYTLLCKLAKEQIEDARIDAYEDGFDAGVRAAEENTIYTDEQGNIIKVSKNNKPLSLYLDGDLDAYETHCNKSAIKDISNEKYEEIINQTIDDIKKQLEMEEK